MATSASGISPLSQALQSLGVERPAPAAQMDPKSAFEGLARQTNVPANVLMALDEADGGGADLDRARRNADFLGKRLAGGAKLDDVVAEMAGDAERGAALMSRSYDIADALYPEQAAPKAAPGIGTDLKDLSKLGVAGAVNMTGGALQALGAVADDAIRAGARAELEASGGDPAQVQGESIVRSGSRAAADAVRGAGDAVAGSISDRMKQAMEGTRFEGELFSPSTWSAGDDPSIRGVLGHTAQGLGSMIPVAAASAVAGPTGTAVMGGLGAAGEGAQSGRDFVQAARGREGEAGPAAIEAMPAFRALLDQGLSPDEAAAELAGLTESEAAAWQAIPGTVGGAATGKILSRAEGMLNAGGRAARAAKKGLAGAIEEGVQEAAEGMASQQGIAAATGADVNTQQDSFGNFVLGALSGGVMGSGAGLLGPGQTDSEQSGDATGDAPLGDGDSGGPDVPLLPAPENGGTIFGMSQAQQEPGNSRPDAAAEAERIFRAQPDTMDLPEDAPILPEIDGEFTEIPMISDTSPDGSGAGAAAVPGGAASLSGTPGAAATNPAIAAPAPPAGPVERIAQGIAAATPPALPAPPQRFPDQKPGSPVRFGDPASGQIIDGVFLGETEGGARVRLAGREIDLTPEQFDAGRDAVAGIEEARKRAEQGAKAARKALPAPQQEIQTDVEPGIPGQAPGVAGDGAGLRVADAGTGGGEGSAQGRSAEQEGRPEGQGVAGSGVPAGGEGQHAGSGDLGGLDVADDAGQLRGSLTGEIITPDDDAQRYADAARYAGFERTDAPAPASAPWWAAADEETRAAILKEAGPAVQRDFRKALVWKRMSDGAKRGLQEAYGRLYRAGAIQNVGTIESPKPALTAPPPSGAEAQQNKAERVLPSPESGPASTTPAWPWRGKKMNAKTRQKAMADYLTPGNIIEGYGGERQRVVAFDPKANSITIEPVEQRNEEWVGTGERRTHGTWPADRELQRGPLSRAPSPINAAADEAHTEPTAAQKEAGNYRKGHVRWNGLDLSIENAKGSERRGTGPDGRGEARLGGIKKMSVADLKAWLASDATKNPVSMRARRAAAQKPAPAPQKRPLMAYVTKRLGGINPTGRVAEELRARGVNARTAPGLWRRGGHRDMDNIPAGDHPDLEALVGRSDDGLYLDPARIIEAIVEEVAGRPQPLGEQAVLQQQARATEEAADHARLQEADHVIVPPADDPRPEDERRSGVEGALDDFLAKYAPGALTESERAGIVEILTRDGGDIDALVVETASQRPIDDDLRATENGLGEIPFGDAGSGKRSDAERGGQDGSEPAGGDPGRLPAEERGADREGERDGVTPATEAGNSAVDWLREKAKHDPAQDETITVTPEIAQEDGIEPGDYRVRYSFFRGEIPYRMKVQLRGIPDRTDFALSEFIRFGNTRATQDRLEYTKVERERIAAPATESGAEGKPQTIIPGAERSDAQAQQAEADRAKLEMQARQQQSKIRRTGGNDGDAGPLSKSWPAPDYEKLIEAGVEPWKVSFIRAARDSIPTKPQKSWRLSGWVEAVTAMRRLAQDVMDGKIGQDKLRQALAGGRASSEILGQMKLYEAVGHGKSLKGMTLGEVSYSMLAGVRYEKPKAFWEVSQKAKATAFSNMPRTITRAETEAEAIEQFKRAYGGLDDQKAKAQKARKWLIYSHDGRKFFTVGTKIGSTYIQLRRVDDVKEARRIIAEEADALQQQLDRLREIPADRKPENAPRIGIDHRGGADVTPEVFGETFGFRGVQFGNWVGGGRRQQDLNDAFDALMDLAGVLDIPPRAISLNGTLGLAFGARGSGGVSPAAAHYEPNQVVINLTKMNGAGSLAHEWFHALDNYFARAATDKKGNYITDRAVGSGAWAEGVRPEVMDALIVLRRAIANTGLEARSANIDKTRSKAYWSTGIEMHARAFESYVIAKLQDQSIANDYLANIVNGVSWQMKAELSGLGDSYPYLKPDEIETVRPAFDALFDAIQTRETDSGIEMYQRDMSAAAMHVPTSSLRGLADSVTAILRQHGLTGKVSPKIVRELLTATGVPVHGSYRGGEIKVSAGSRDAIHTARHEVIHALRDPALWGRRHGLFTVEEWQALARAARRNPALRQAVEAAYPDLSTPGQTEEMVAEMYADWARGRDANPPGPVRAALERIASFFRAMAAALRGEGFVDAAQVMERIASGEIGGRGPDGSSSGRGDGAAQYQRDGHTTDIQSVIEAARSPGHAPQRAETGKTADWVVDAAREAGVDLDGLAHVIDGSAVRHIFGRHGNDKAEARRGQTAVTESDILALGDVIADPDGVAFGSQTRIGRPAVIYAKVMPDNTVLLVEELWNKRGEAAVNTMWKMASAAKDAYALERILLSNARNDSGAEIKVFTKEEFVKEQRDLSALKDQLSRSGARAKGMIGDRHWQRTPKVFSEWMSSFLTDRMGADSRWNILGLVPGHALFSELGKDMPAAQDYLRLKHAMDSDRNEWQAKTSAKVDQWVSEARRSPRSNEALMDLMHETTMLGLDPTVADGWKRPVDDEARRVLAGKPSPAQSEWARITLNDAEERRAKWEDLRAKFSALPKPFQDLYSEIRDTYAEMADASEAALLENLRQASKIVVARADREYAAELQRIKDDGLTGEARAEAVEAANEKKTKAHTLAAAGGASKMKQLRQMFESNRLAGPYFPLSRFGNYFVTIRDADGKVTSFSRFERERDQKRWMNEAEQQGLGRVEHGVLGNDPKLSEKVDPAFVADVEEMLMESGASREMMDAVWQRWLETLPDQSMRTSRIHRKNRMGFNNDAIRAFSSAMFHGAHQTARLRYGAQMEEELELANEQSKSAPDPNRAGFVVNEMKQRHAFTMAPTNNKWVTTATSMAFIWSLAANPAAAAVNLTQTTVVGVPIMAARYRKAGVGGVTRELAKASRDFMRGQGKVAKRVKGLPVWTDTWSAEKSDSLSADEKAAMKAGYDLGIMDKTQAHDLAAVADSGVEYNPTRERVMRAMSWSFHHAERFNREVTFLAAYRLARDEGMTHDAAVSSAASITWKTHFDVQNSSRPRAMQGDAAKVITIFRSFQANMLWRLFRDMHQTFNGADAETRSEARAQLIGVSLSMMAHAGIRGVWGYALIMSLLALFFPGDDDDMDDWLQDALLIEGDSMGVAAWNWTMGLALNGVPGHALGVDLTNRIGMPELWIRGDDRDREGQDLWHFYTDQLLGPAFGILGNGVMAGSMAMDGQYWRAFEKASPAMVRNPMKGYRYARDGVTTYNGDPLIEDVSPWQVLMQMQGFAPAEVAERYRINNRLKNREKEISDRRTGIMREMGDAMRKGEPIPEKAIKQMREFNREFPEWAITARSIKQSFQSRQRASARNELGVSINPKINDRLRAEQPPALYGA